MCPLPRRRFSKLHSTALKLARRSGKPSWPARPSGSLLKSSRVLKASFPQPGFYRLLAQNSDLYPFDWSRSTSSSSFPGLPHHTHLALSGRQDRLGLPRVKARTRLTTFCILSSSQLGSRPCERDVACPLPAGVQMWRIWKGPRVFEEG